MPAPRTRARRIGGWVATLLVVAFLGAALVTGWEQVTAYDWEFHAGFLALAVAAIGAALAFVRSRTGSIYPAMLMHGAFNGTQMLLGAFL